jgi:hypothetical protein
MPNAPKVLMFALGAVAVAACHKQPQQSAAANQDMSVDDNLTSGQLPGNAEIETLPPDESSTTPSNQLQNGYDNPDVNDLGNSD